MAGKTVYLDTSGVLAYLDRDEDNHPVAAREWAVLLESGVEWMMTDYVRLECWSLIQRRLGMPAVRDFYDVLLRNCRIFPVGEEKFPELARSSLLGNRRQVSLVDISSFFCMRETGIHLAFAFDVHFSEQGFLTPETPGWREG